METPLGEVAIDRELCDALMAASDRLEDDFDAHRLEHAIEVQLPFLQYLCNGSFQIAPVSVATTDWDELAELGMAIGEILTHMNPPPLILASTDMNHYQSDAITRGKDARTLERLLELDARGLYETVLRHNISMCGLCPATTALVACRLLGADHAELVKYATSADVSHDYDRVVGYAGIIISRRQPSL